VLVAAIEDLRERHLQGRLGPNLDGRAYALEEFDEEKLMRDLVAILRAQFSMEVASDPRPPYDQDAVREPDRSDDR
jgi:hypothetical protein